MLKILVAEDNVDLRNLMKIRLHRAGYEVLDGCELTAALRGANIEIPVLMVTARGELDDKRMGFQSGADDYLVKPVDMDELLLHVGALLRRSRMSRESEMTVGTTVLNEDRLSVTRAGQEILFQSSFLIPQSLLILFRKTKTIIFKFILI